MSDINPFQVPFYNQELEKSMKGDPLRKGRLGGERPQEVMEFLSSMGADRWIGRADLIVDIAHLLMLEKQEIIDREAAVAVMKALLAMVDEGLPESVYDDRYEDIHAGIEANLIDSVGMDFGGRLHMGRSRNDEVATCIRLSLRREMLSRMSEINSLRQVLLDLASVHTQSVMPGFTHLQHAQPTTLAHYMLSYEQAFSRDFDRFRDTYARVNLCPLGAAAFASTGYPIDREYTADLLGFDGLVKNSMDAVSARDFALEVISDCTIIMSTVSRLCEELVVWSSGFVKFVDLNDTYCSTSSIMPQKKNPDTAEIMRGKAGTVTGALTAALMIVKGLPMSYNRDLQELTPHLWTAVSETGICIRLLAGMVETAVFNVERMRSEADSGFATATELADVMVRDYGLPFRFAHGIVGRAVRNGRLDLETLEAAAEEMGGISLIECGLTEESVLHALDVDFSITVRAATGGPAPEASEALLSEKTGILSDDIAWVCDVSERINLAEEMMIKKAGELIL